MKKNIFFRWICIIGLFTSTVLSQPIDKKGWKTWCVGRYLIDMPQDAETHWHDTKILSPKNNNMIWRKDLTPKTARKELDMKAKDLSKEERITSTEIIKLPNGGWCLQTRKNIGNGSITKFYCRFVTPSPKVRVFAHDDIWSGLENEDLVKKYIIYLAKSLRARDDNDPIPTGPGFCFPNGFLATSSKDADRPSIWMGAEEIGISFKLPQYKGVVMAFHVDAKGTQEKMYKLPSRILGFKKEKFLRRHYVTLDGRKGIEVCTTEVVKDNSRKNYEFYVDVPSQGKRLDKANLHFILTTIGGGQLDYNPYVYPDVPKDSFGSNEEALSLYDAIKNTIRFRPGAL